MSAELSRPPSITRAADADFDAVGRLHAAGIAEGFLSSLGERFLAVLYHAIHAAPSSGVLVAKDTGTVLGFLAYSADLPACYRWVMTRRFLPLGLALLPSLVRPSVWTRSVETAFYPFRRHRGRMTEGRGQRSELRGQPERLREAPLTSDFCPLPSNPKLSSGSHQASAELLSMAVSEEARGRGVGKALVAAMEAEFRRLGVDRYLVVTDARDARSNAFYQACGGVLWRSFTNHGKPMHAYEKRMGRQLTADS